MTNQFTPQEKHVQHRSKFIKWLIIIFSSIGSFLFVSILTQGAVFYHWYHKFTGKERFNEPIDIDSANGYKPRKPYDDTKSMKPTTDLRYYAQAMKLDLQEYRVTTPDGYILTLHRLIDPSETSEVRDQRKPFLLQHGLLSCSGSYITSGRNSLAYYLVEQGYDVWLGNNRSWFEAVHTHYEGNLYNNEQYWDWGMTDLAYYDLPTLIENVLSHKPHHDKLALAGHSQGGLQSFIMFRNEEMQHISEKIEYFFGLAPAVYPGVQFHRGFLKFLGNRSRTGWVLLFGACAFLRNLCYFRIKIGETWLFGRLAYYLFKYLFGWNARNWGKDKKVWHFCFIFNVTYVSVKLMNYYCAKFYDCGFAATLQPKKSYEIGENHTVNSKFFKEGPNAFFPFKQSWFENCRVKVPMMIFTGEIDYLVDGTRLISHMKNFEPDYVQGENFDFVDIAMYNHLDVIWAEDLIGHIGYRMMEKLKHSTFKFEESKPVEQVVASSSPETVTIDKEKDDKLLMTGEQPELIPVEIQPNLVSVHA
ncbi:Sterol esterase 1 [Spathaspora sp. JA1]|nr:Sterol esterase 1 [Spathaspora sp. JA1]